MKYCGENSNLENEKKWDLPKKERITISEGRKDLKYFIIKESSLESVKYISPRRRPPFSA